MFTGFGNSNGDVSIYALVEQSTILGALYWNRRDLAEAAIGICGGGTLLAWQFQTDSFPPSWALIRQGNNLYLMITGTVNIQQVAGDIVGVFSTDYNGGQCAAHRFFLASWATLKTQITPSLPADWTNCDMHFFGHSLGGAIAHLGALEWARDNPGIYVEVIRLACPKSLTQGYSSPDVPVSWFHVSFSGDPITFLPPAGLLPVLPLNVIYFGIAASWTHYGKGYTIDVNGSLTPTPASSWDRSPTPGESLGGNTTHRIATYMQAAESGLQQLPPGLDFTLISLSQQIRALPAVQNQNVNIDSANFIDIPYTNEKILLQPPPGPLTVSNLNLLSYVAANRISITRTNPILSRLNLENGMATKATFFYSIGTAGESESWYIPGVEPTAVTLDQLTAYLYARMKCSGLQTVLTYVRLASVGAVRRVITYFPGDFQNPNALTGWAQNRAGTAYASDFSGTSLLLRKYNNLSSALWYFRGQPDYVIDNGGQYVPDAQFTININALFAAIITLGWGWNQSAQVAGGPFPLVGATQIADGTATLTFSGNPFAGIAAQKPVLIRVRKQRTPAGMNGSKTAYVQTANTCNTLRPLGVAGFIQGIGSAFVYTTPTFLPILKGIVERAVKRGAGRPQLLFRGRAKIRGAV